MVKSGAFEVNQSERKIRCGTCHCHISGCKKYTDKKEDWKESRSIDGPKTWSYIAVAKHLETAQHMEDSNKLANQNYSKL